MKLSYGLMISGYFEGLQFILIKFFDAEIWYKIKQKLNLKKFKPILYNIKKFVYNVSTK